MIIKSDETGNVDQMISILQTFFEEATDVVEQLINSDFVEDAMAIGKDIGSELSNAIKGYRACKSIASIPTKMYMHKFERFCKGIYEIPIEKRQSYIQTLGRHKFNQESYFILNSINRIEEEEKIPLLVKLLEARTERIIDDIEYRRLTILVDRTLYSDLIYLKDHITSDPVALSSASDFGLVASGLLVTAGSQWVGDYVIEHDPTDTGIRFNYTSSAKKLAFILWNISCEETSTNNNIIYFDAISQQDTHQ